MRRSITLEPGGLAGLSGPWAIVAASVWDGSGAIHEALSVDGHGRVAWIGTTADVLEQLPRSADVVDGAGAFVCPGFVDPHLHIRAAASARLATDVSGARRAEDVLDTVARRCTENAGWTTIVGWRSGREVGAATIDRCHLDRVSNGRAVRVRERSGHAWLFNTMALASLGLDSATDLPAGVAVERATDGSPTGFITDHIGWVGRALGRLSDADEMDEAVAGWSLELARAGVVAVCDATATNDADTVATLRTWRERGLLRQQTTVLLGPDAPDDAFADPAVIGRKLADATDPRLPALLAAPEQGTVAVHCVEPHETAKALAAAQQARPRPGRLRLEHASYVPPEWIPDVRASGAVVVTHPSFVRARGDAYLADPMLEPHDWLYRLASWHRAGVPLAFASDAPFGPEEPLQALRDAATRRTAGGRTLGRSEALAGDTALRAVTSTAAAAAGLAASGRGSIRTGGAADVVVLDDDPRRAGATPSLVATVIGGDVVD